MRRWTIIILMMLWMLNIVIALPICSDTPIPNTNCLVVTPSLNCSSFELFNTSGVLVDNGTLEIFNDTIFQFNFSQDRGEYVIKYCEGSTRQIFVEGDDMTAWIALIIGMVSISGVLLYGGSQIKNLEFKPVKDFLIFYGIIHTFFTGITTFVLVSNPNNISSFLPVAKAYAGVNILIIMFLIFIIGIGMIVRLFKFIFSRMVGSQSNNLEEEDE